MRIYEYTKGKRIEGSRAIALGLFDGVHTGHRLLLNTAKNAALERGLTFSVFTFYAEDGLKDRECLYSTSDKLDIFESLGAEEVILAHFSDISEISAESFVGDTLICDLSAALAVSGKDFRFGKGARGDSRLLGDILSSRGIEYITEDEHKIRGEKISTRRIKELISLGDVGAAREFLGSPYFITGEVKRGNGVGHTLGFPTLNFELDPGRTALARGVYRTATAVGERLFSSITNIGTCPTFLERGMHAESYILDFSGDLYGENIRTFFLGYLREEKRFSSEKELIMQINVDKNRTIKENGDLTWQEIGLSLPQK